MHGRIAALALVAALLGGPSAARAQTWLGDPAASGTQTAAVGDARLKLPPGTWELLTETGSGSSNVNAIVWKSQAYVQVLDGKPAAILVVGANDGPAVGRGARWRVPAQCGFQSGPSMVVDARNVDNAYGTYDCMVATFIKTDGIDGSTWPAVTDRAKRLGGLPPAMVYIALTTTSQSRRDSVMVEMFLNPTTPSFGAAVRAAGIGGKVTPGDLLTMATSWAAAYRPTVAASLP